MMGSQARWRAGRLGGAALAAVLILGGCGGGGGEAPELAGASQAVVNDFALTPFAYGPKCGFVDAKGKLVITPQFEAARQFVRGADLAPVKVAGKWGLVDREGRFAVTPQFQSLWPSGDGKAFWVQVANRWGLIDAKGQFLINPRYDRREGDFDAKGRAIVQVGRKAGVINRKGELVIPATFDAIVSRGLPDERSAIFANGLALAYQNGKVGFIDEKGAWVINPQFADARWFDQAGLAAVSTGTAQAPRWGFIDRKGAFVIAPQFEAANPFGAGGLAAVRVGDVWGFIDKKGEYRINPQFTDVRPFADGPGGPSASVAVRGGDGVVRWGMIDPKGNFRIQPQFDSLGAFDRNGRAVAGMGDQLGLIDERGRFIVNPMYSQVSLLPGSSDYLVTRTVGGAGAAAGTIEVGRMKKDGKVVSTITGVRCPRQ